MELKDLVKYYVPMRMEGSSPPNWEVVFGYDISKFKGYNVDEVRVALNLTQLWLSQGPRAPTTAFPEATTTSEPAASSSVPRWYAADYHHPLPATGAYVDVPGYATLSGLRRGPESCGSRSRGSGRSSNRSLTRSEIKEALRGATSELVGDLTQEIRAKLEPLIPPQASPTMVGISPHRVQANHLVAGLTNTLGSLRSRPMPTPAAIPRSPFVPRTAQPPYSHVGNFARAELDRLGLTALRAMVDVEPYGSSDLGGDPSDDEPPSMTSASRKMSLIYALDILMKSCRFCI